MCVKKEDEKVKWKEKYHIWESQGRKISFSRNKIYFYENVYVTLRMTFMGEIVFTTFFLALFHSPLVPHFHFFRLPYYSFKVTTTFTMKRTADTSLLYFFSLNFPNTFHSTEKNEKVSMMMKKFSPGNSNVEQRWKRSWVELWTFMSSSSLEIENIH